jgi:hypothetical protein
LCKFLDSGKPPYDPFYYYTELFQMYTGGLGDYVHDMSNGIAHLKPQGYYYHGWYTIPKLHAEDDDGKDDRPRSFQDCLLSAEKGDRFHPPYKPSADEYVFRITFPGAGGDWGSSGAYAGFTIKGYTAVGHDTYFPNIAHEFGHALGLSHSWSNDAGYAPNRGGQLGEYDDEWDVMGNFRLADHKHLFLGAHVASAVMDGPPGMNAHHLDELGWIPMSRILTVGADGQSSATVTLAALNHPETEGYLLVRVPFDPRDLFRYYTVEFRRADGWDRGISKDVVLIHEIKTIGNDQYVTFLQRAPAEGNPDQSLNRNGVTISVQGLSQGPSGNQATVTVSTSIVASCLDGYVPRQARPSDNVCVTPMTRTQTAADNAAAGSTHIPGSNSCKCLPTAPGKPCFQLYPRGAFTGDYVCVSKATRDQAAKDNALAADRINPARLVFGPNTCADDYVWREADDSDYVCVTPDTQALTLADNMAARMRRMANSDNCISGYVWREAFPEDHVCVLPSTHSQAATDNAQAGSRLKKPNA